MVEPENEEVEFLWKRFVFTRNSSYCSLSHRNSVCSCVSPSVRLSHGCISEKWCKL